jgi:hypothetical protein
MGSGFDYITQGQGPAVSISLFGDASSQGINSGNAQKTTTQSVFEGITKGIQQGTSIASGIEQVQGQQQENTIRQNKIDHQLGPENVILEQNAEQEKQQTQSNKIKLDEDIALKDKTLATDSVALDAKKQDLENHLSVGQALKDFSQAFDNAAPRDKANMVLGSQYTTLFGANPALYKSALNAIQDNKTLSPEEQAFIQTTQKRVGATDFYQREAFKRQATFSAAKDTYLADPVVTQLQQSLAGPPESYSDKVKFVPKGQYQTDPTTGNVILNKKTNKPEINANIAPTKMFDVMQVDAQGQPTRVVATDASQKSFEAFTKYQHELKYQNGTYGNQAASEITQPPSQQQTKPKLSQLFATKPKDPTQTQGSPINSTQTVPTGSERAPINRTTDPFHASIINQLGLSNDAYTTLKPSIDSLQSQTTEYSNAVNADSRVAAQLKLNSSIKDIARGITDNDFDNNAKVRSLYTPEKVTKYNKSLEDTLGAKLKDPYATRFEKETAEAILAGYKVETPKDLYFVNHAPTIVRGLYASTRQQINRDQRNREAPIRKQSAGLGILSLLAGG